jgi:hypothetical protein
MYDQNEKARRDHEWGFQARGANSIAGKLIGRSGFFG